EGRLAAVPRRLAAHPFNETRGVLERLAPQHVEVVMRGQGAYRGVRAAAAVNGDMRLPPAADVGEGCACPVEFAVMGERLRLRPGASQQRDVFGGTAIAGGMVGPVAVLCLIRVAAAGDDVHRETAAAQLIERRELARGERRR